MSEVAVIFGMQRCGSNFFLSACSRFEDLTVFGEMYHRGGVFPFSQDNFKDFAVKERLAWFIRNEFQDAGSQDFIDWDFATPYSPESDALLNKALVQFSHKYPVKYFKAVKDSAPASRLLFKIFPEHLSIFQILSILHQTRPHVILMVRDPLDSFISYKKLTETKKPQDVDTSGLKIVFNRAEYYEYKAQLVAYFKAISDYCSDEKIDVTVVPYEELHQDDGQDKIEKVRLIVEGVFKSPVQLSADPGRVKLFRKQDKSGSAADKVTNPGQLPRSSQRLIEEGVGR
jgi:Sulfotransferase family